jgi:hypothetical protein
VKGGEFGKMIALCVFIAVQQFGFSEEVVSCAVVS